MTTRKALSALYNLVRVAITFRGFRNDSIGITAPEVIWTRPAKLTTEIILHQTEFLLLNRKQTNNHHSIANKRHGDLMDSGLDFGLGGLDSSPGRGMG